MQMAKITHKSVVDWDFQAGMHHILNNIIFISEPSSLECFWQPGNPLDSTLLCRIAETLCIPEGELRTWYRSTNWTRDMLIEFRNQHPLGGANWDNSYYWSITSSLISLARRIAGVHTAIGNFPWVGASNTWYHFRTVFWNGADGEGNPALAVQLFLEVAEEWVQQGETLYDTQNQWKDSEINRLGIGGRTDSAPHHYFDDTEIWGAV